MTRLVELGNSESTTQIREDVEQIPDEVHVDNLSGAAPSIPLSYPLVSANNYLTVLPVETEFDSKTQAVVHGSVDAVTEQDSTTFEAIDRMAVFDSETQSFWVAPRPTDKSGVVCDELSGLPRKMTTLQRQPLRTSHQQTCRTSGSSRMTVQWPKSRNVLVGWKDPMIYQLERAAPTPTQEGIMVTLQWLASATVTGCIADLTNALGEARKTSRKKQTCHKTATGRDSSKVGRGQLLRVEREIYGLVSGPSWLRANLTVDLLAAGHEKESVRQMLVHIVLFR